MTQTNTGLANNPKISQPRLPYHTEVGERFKIDRASWRALVDAIFPNATSTDSVILALSYCKARNLDPFKRNVHIVPIWDKSRGGMVDTIWPGIGELRTTAFRTGEYAGRDATEFGPSITKEFAGTVGKGQYERSVTIAVTFPEWGQVTVYRMVKGVRVAFTGPRVYWLEAYSAQGRSDVPNEMWESRPCGQLDKCSEAAALRAAFPEEVGSDYTNDEARGPRKVESTVVKTSSVDSLNARLGEAPADEIIDGEHEQHQPDDNPAGDAGATDNPPTIDSKPLPPIGPIETYATFIERLEEAAMDAGKQPSDVTAVMSAIKLMDTPIAKDTAASKAWRGQIIDAARAGKLDWATGMIGNAS